MPENNAYPEELKVTNNGNLAGDQRIIVIGASAGGFEALKAIVKDLPANFNVISQGKIVADSLADYLERHPEIKDKCSKTGQLQFYTTDSATDFDQHSQIFFGSKVNSQHVDL